MRVFVAGLRGFPSVMGGVESHAEQLYPRIAMQEPGIDITVLARTPYVGRKSYRFRGVDIVPLPSTRLSSTEAMVGTLLSTLYARYRGAELYHLHAIGPALFAPVARLLGMRVVVTHHGEDYQREKWGSFAKAVLRFGEAVSIRFADRVIVVAPSLREVLAKAYPRFAHKLVYIPNGSTEIDPEAASVKPVLDRAGLAVRDYILTVGRLVPEKAFDQLIAAVRRVPGRRLLIVGGADHQSAYSRRLLDEAGDDIVFAGVQDKATLRDLYLNCGLFVLPSLHEGLPIAALEAGSLAAPLLLSDIPANRDLGLPAHNYFRAGNVDDLVDKLAQPYSDFAIDVAALRDRFDWDAVARQTLAVYTAACPRPAGART